DLAELQAAYGINGARVAGFASKLAAAEMFARTGVNLVSVVDRGWDTHGDRTGTVVRNRMSARAPAIRTFLSRMVSANAPRNVVVCMMGDFARSLPGSDHQPNLSVTVIGKHVKRGTTGQVSANVALPSGTPSTRGMWAYLAAAAKVKQSPFGADPHKLIV